MEKTNSLERLFETVFIRLGGSSIEVEIEPDDYMVAFDEGLRMLRSLSRNSIDEGWLFMNLTEGESEYFLPEEIDNVIEIKRMRTAFIVGGANYDPFAQAFINHMLLTPGQVAPSVVNFELLSGYHEQIGKMFGEHVMFEFNAGNGRLFLWRRILKDELIGLHVSKLRPIDELLRTNNTYRFLQDYTLAALKTILGEKYSKFSVMPGPQSGTTLKGGDLKAEGQQEKEKLKDDLLNYEDNHWGANPFFG